MCSSGMKWHGASLLSLKLCWQVGILLCPTSVPLGAMSKIVMAGGQVGGGRVRETQRDREITVERNAYF